jgi:UDP-4-amino-4-deoxy-L-arabinose formyltransferase/UDP-glucuronic acid dehydrogenase (UDP-4-keto-hexauronic acid decarboxylating)
VRTLIRYGEGPQPAVTGPVDFEELARQRQFTLLVPPQGDINQLEFIESLRRKLKPTIALSYFCLSKFSPELLSVFDYTVNYHNGLLPEYKGLRATAWSVYFGESETGFSFHRMEKDLDQGQILLQGVLPTGNAERTAQLDLEKTRLAAERIPAILQMASDRYPGMPQIGKGRYFSRNDYREIIRVPDPEALTSEELARRLKAFSLLEIAIGDRWYRVTGMRNARRRIGSKRNLYFQTADGVLLQVTHINFLPYAMFRASEFVLRTLRPER